MPAARDRAYYSPSAGADQTAAHRPIRGIVRVREGRGRQHQSSADHAGYGRLLCHLLYRELREWRTGLDQLRSRSSSNSSCKGANKRRAVAVPVLGGLLLAIRTSRGMVRQRPIEQHMMGAWRSTLPKTRTSPPLRGDCTSSFEVYESIRPGILLASPADHKSGNSAWRISIAPVSISPAISS